MHSFTRNAPLRNKEYVKIKVVINMETVSANEHVIRTFNMLTERISNLEDLAQRRHQADVFAECRKFGELNKVTLGCPFTIIRRRPFSPSPTRPKYPGMSSMLGVFVDISTLSADCRCIEDTSSVYEAVVGSEVADKSRHIEYPLSHEVGWMNSRFRWAEDEAIQQRLDTIFGDSQFQCTHIQREEFGIKCYISLRELPRISMEVPIEDPPSVQLDQFIKQIPKLIKTTHRNVNCISKAVITCTSGGTHWADAVTSIQKAANLPDGPLKEHWIYWRDFYSGIDGWKTLANERTLIEVAEVFSHLRSIGKQLYGALF